jgi:hypothetical protein
MNIPIAAQLAGSSGVLIAGAGGGYDIFCGIPVYLELRQRGIRGDGRGSPL